jgi:hypothetical protein
VKPVSLPVLVTTYTVSLLSPLREATPLIDAALRAFLSRLEEKRIARSCLTISSSESMLFLSKESKWGVRTRDAGRAEKLACFFRVVKQAVFVQ